MSELDASQVEPYLAAQLPARIPVDELIRHGSSFCLSGPGPGADFGGSRYFGGDLVAICLHQSGGDPDVLTRLVGAAGLRPRQDLPSRAAVLRPSGTPSSIGRPSSRRSSERPRRARSSPSWPASTGPKRDSRPFADPRRHEPRRGAGRDRGATPPAWSGDQGRRDHAGEGPKEGQFARPVPGWAAPMRATTLPNTSSPRPMAAWASGSWPNVIVRPRHGSIFSARTRSL